MDRIKQEVREYNAVWEHGRKKGILTGIKNKLLKTDIAKHPDIIKAIAVIDNEIKRLKSINPLEQ